MARVYRSVAPLAPLKPPERGVLRSCRLLYLLQPAVVAHDEGEDTRQEDGGGEKEQARVEAARSVAQGPTA